MAAGHEIVWEILRVDSRRLALSRPNECLLFHRPRRVIACHVTASAYTRHELNSIFMDYVMTLRQSIETYILAKDGNRPHLMSRAFAADAELVMDVKTDEISFPKNVRGVAGISATLVSEFAQRYENVYTFCTQTPADTSAAFVCNWLVCMTEKGSGAARVGFGGYEWLCRDDSGTIAKLTITIEEMKTLPSELGGPILEWASTLPYPWCPHDLPLQSAPNIREVQEIASRLARSATQLGL